MSNSLKHWFTGLPSEGVEVASNDSGTQKYWSNGLPNEEYIISEGGSVTYSQDSSAKANILTGATVSNDISTKSNIKVTNSQGSSSKSNLSVTNTAGESAKADILRTYSSDTSTKASLVATVSQNNSAKSSLVRTETSSNSSKLSIVRTESSGTNSLANITSTSTRNNSAIASILVAGQLGSSAKANIRVLDIASGNSVKTNLLNTSIGNNSAKLNIVSTNQNGISARANLVAASSYQVSSRASILITGISVANSTKANILSTYQKGLSTLGSILSSGQQASSAKANIKAQFTQGSSAKAFIEKYERYWVGGTGNWSDATNHWAVISGGTPAAVNAPNLGTNVNIDSNSGFVGGGTLTVNTTCNFKDFLANSGHSYNITNTGGNNYLNCYGSLTLETGITFTGTLFRLSLYATTLGKTITTAGKTFLIVNVGMSAGFGGWTLQDDLITTGRFYQQAGAFDANNHNVTANDFYFYADTGYTPTIVMGSGTWESTRGSGESISIYEYSGEIVNIQAETSTIKVTGATAMYGYFYISTADSDPTVQHTFNNLWIVTTFTERYRIYGSNTFNEIKVDAPNKLEFNRGSTTTVTTWNVSGTEGNLINIDSFPGAGTHTLSKSSGVVNADYLNISNSTATGGAIWNAGSHSIDTVNNSGWIFNYSKDSSTLASIVTTEAKANSARASLWIPASQPNTAKANILVINTEKSNSAKAFVENNQRYWIGGTGNWSDSAHWSALSGGTGGAPVPAETQDVFIDANSGFGSGGMLTLDGVSGKYASIHDLTCTSGHTYTINKKYSDTSGGMWIRGSLELESGLTFNPQFLAFEEALVREDKTIRLNGCTTNVFIAFQTEIATDTYTLLDSLTTNNEFYIENGIFDANDQNITAKDFYFYSGFGCAPTIYMGSGTWEATRHNVVWNVDENNGQLVTIIPETSTIKFTDATGNSRSFLGGGKTYHILWLDEIQDFDISTYIYGSNTFNEFKVTNAPKTITFEAGSTQTVNSFTVSGTAGNLITLDKTSFGDPQFYLSKSSGIVECDYLNIEDSSALGGATWYAGEHSNDLGNNDGWIFWHTASNSIKANILPIAENFVKASIFAGNTVDQSAKANITILGTKDTSTKASIKTSVNKGVSALANLNNLTQSPHSARANIFRAGEKLPTSSKASLVVTPTSGNSAKASLRTTTISGQRAKASLLTHNSANHSVLGNILVAKILGNSSRGDILRRGELASTQAKASLVITNTDNLQAKASIVVRNSSINQAKASLMVRHQSDNTGKASIVTTPTGNSSAKASIVVRSAFGQNPKASLRRTESYGSFVKSSIVTTPAFNQLGKASLVNTHAFGNSAKAAIYITGIKSNFVKADIGIFYITYPVPNSALANIRVLDSNYAMANIDRGGEEIYIPAAVPFTKRGRIYYDFI